MKFVNIVYPPHKGDSIILYKGEEGTVFLSSVKNTTMPNVYTSRYSCRRPTCKDYFIQLEPVVVNPFDYDVKYLKKFKKIFGCFLKVFENTCIASKYVFVNYGSILSYKDPDILKSLWKNWQERLPAVAIVSAGKKSDHVASIYNLREEIADFLHSNGFSVAWYGSLPEKTNKPYFKGRVDDKVDELRKYRFHLCSENTYHHIYSQNYFTEKMRDAIYSGSVPLYIGCYNIDEFAPKDAFFDLRKYCDDKGTFLKKSQFLKDLLNFNESDYKKYQESAYNYLKSPTGLMYQIDMKRYCKKILFQINK